MTLDRRPTRDESVEVEKQRLLELLEGAEVEIFQEAPSASSPDDGPVANALAEAVAEPRGRAAALRDVPRTARDTLVRAAGHSGLRVRPGCLEVAHQAEEHVEIPRLLRAVDIYARTALPLLGRRGGEWSLLGAVGGSPPGSPDTLLGGVNPSSEGSKRAR